MKTVEQIKSGPV